MLTQTQKIIRDLGDGLILRHASPEDAEALPAFNAVIHGDDEEDGRHVAAWTRDLLTRPHPTFKPEDFTVIEDTSSGRIVSSMNLIPQTWSYEGIPFEVGRPELVGTAPEYRSRGLVRTQFEVIHQWSAERGQMVQIITGIPYYYRLFGYEMALDLAGHRFGYEPHVPMLKEGEQEKYFVRPAVEADLPFIAEVYAHAIQHHALACVKGPEILKYEWNGRSAENVHNYAMFVIENAKAEPVGYLQHQPFLGRTGLTAVWYELKPGASWLDVTPSVVRYLWNKGREYGKRDGKTVTTFGFMMGAQHPVYEVLGDGMPAYRAPYAFYMRVRDLPGFLNHIKPALEKRLKESIAVGYSREIKISFYRDGLRFVIEHGKLSTIERWMPAPNDGGDIAFPELTFLQVLFGYRSLDELEKAFADCWCDHQDVRVLFNILFPKKLSSVFPVA